MNPLTEAPLPQLAVLGFMFTLDKSKVVLIDKKRPDFQRGKFNGVGGKIEQGEAFKDAMSREFFEETGVKTSPRDWQKIAELRSDFWTVSVFRAFSDDVWEVTSKTDEDVHIVEVRELEDCETMRNTRWLVPFCLDDSPYDLPVIVVEHGDGREKALPAQDMTDCWRT